VDDYIMQRLSSLQRLFSSLSWLARQQANSPAGVEVVEPVARTLHQIACNMGEVCKVDPSPCLRACSAIRNCTILDCMKNSGAFSTKSTKPAVSAAPSTQPSEDVVRSPRTGKLIRKSLNDEILRQQEATKKLDWRKRRVF